MRNVIPLPERAVSPLEPVDHSWCDGCGGEVQEETWPLGARNLCRPHALLALAEATMDGFDRLNFATAVMHRDILIASMQATEKRLMKITNGAWCADQKR